MADTMVDVEVDVHLDSFRVTLAVLLGTFLVTFVVTRLITRSIRRGRGPFGNTSVGGVHVHHQVYGIFLMLVSGTAEFTYRPGTPWVEVLAALFGAGAALTLDEFALWLHLRDVYWSAQGRRSVDAVLVALVLGGLLLLGANPLGDTVGLTAVWTLAVNLLFAIVAIVKGRIVLGLVGVLMPLVAFVAALRLARPGSPWARRWYRPGSRRWERARRRFPPGTRSRWDRIVDLFAVAPAPEPAAAPDPDPER